MTGAHNAALTAPIGERDHVRGPAEATITLVEYGDFECPFCGMAYPVVRELARHLGGRLRVVFRHFPLRDQHPHAQHAAEAAEAAAAQGKFWEMHDRLFEHQRALDDEQLIRHAEELGLDTDRFRRDLTEHRHRERVQEDVLSGLHSGVRGTPTFFLNGVRHEGGWELADLLAAIAAAERAGPPDVVGPAPDIAADEVTLASWESFPASDAPGWRNHA
jgi:protein-disulfide isomerase